MVNEDLIYQNLGSGMKCTLACKNICMTDCVNVVQSL